MITTTTASCRAASAASIRAVALAVVLILGRSASAQPAQPAPDDRSKDAEAAALYDDGKRHFDIGEYVQAIASWKQSYLRSSAPLLLFNIAQAYRLSGNCAQANRFYLNYRRIEKRPKNQAELDKAMARCAGVEPATGDPAAEPSAASTSPAGATGTAGTPASAPGLATESRPAPPPAGAAGAASGGAANPSAAPSPAAIDRPADRPADDPSTSRRWRIAGIVTGAVGVAALAAGGIYAIGAKQDSNTVSGARVGTPYSGDLVSTDNHGRTSASRARVLIGAGAALAVAGGAMWYIGHRQGAQLDVAIAPGHAEVALSCAF
jgi:hypothetical protein